MVDPISAKLVVETGPTSGVSAQQEPENSSNLKRTNSLLSQVLQINKFILAENAGGLLKLLLQKLGIVGAATGGGIGGKVLSGAGLATAGGLGAGALLGGVSQAILGTGLDVTATDEQSSDDFVDQVRQATKQTDNLKGKVIDTVKKWFGIETKSNDIETKQGEVVDALEVWRQDILKNVRGGGGGGSASRGTQVVSTFQGPVNLASNAPIIEVLNNTPLNQTDRTNAILGPIIAPVQGIPTNTGGGS